MRIDDERDLQERLETAFEVIDPRPAPVDDAMRGGRTIRVRRRMAVAAGAAAVVATVAWAVPSLVRQTAAWPRRRRGSRTIRSRSRPPAGARSPA